MHPLARTAHVNIRSLYPQSAASVYTLQPSLSHRLSCSNFDLQRPLPTARSGTDLISPLVLFLLLFLLGLSVLARFLFSQAMKSTVIGYICQSIVCSQTKCNDVISCLNSAVPIYLADLCVEAASVPGRRRLRSASTVVLQVPWSRTSTGQRRFAVFGPSTWNSLPAAL